ncbi:hypothetical protein NONO_c39460 [Nocardia nova SH22a]|uniref:Uncharacterized protein n=1 Tax=Nocardia nova SH22a TaxID=1415166 RepID=W5TH87_9NOCA|nr:hypothetical protein [Nocardia nova]AHH18730.1 hypothetical protein NONO_c39460 [Nocardia nova SH22a]
MPENSSADPVADLIRWQDSGGVWRVLNRRGDGLTIGLFECTGGTQVGRIVSADPALRVFVGERGGSED